MSRPANQASRATRGLDKDQKISLASDLVAAAISGDFDALESALARGADPKRDESQALRCASAFGHLECVKRLIPLSNPLAMKSLPLQTAARHGQSACLSLLMPFMCSESRAQSLFSAAANGHGACVSLLLADGGLDEACLSKILSISLNNGQAGVVELLFERDNAMAARLDLARLAKDALGEGHVFLAGFLLSAAERAALENNVSAIPAAANRRSL